MAYVSGDLCREIDVDIQIGVRNTYFITAINPRHKILD